MLEDVGASEFKLSSQQQSCLSMQWSHQQNSRGIEQTFTLIINQPLSAQPAQIAHTGLCLSLCVCVSLSPSVSLSLSPTSTRSQILWFIQGKSALGKQSPP